VERHVSHVLNVVWRIKVEHSKGTYTKSLK
jgi:hypothetical protein